MSRFFSRRHLIGAGGAMALSPLGPPAKRASSAPEVVPGLSTVTPARPLVAYFTPIRVFDSRANNIELGGAKLRAGESIAITVPGQLDNRDFAIAMFINLTITQTEGSGYLVVRGSDLSGERPFPNTSNINWSSTGQTLANLVFTTVGGENAIEVHAGGVGRTHFIVDVQGYVPFTP